MLSSSLTSSRYYYKHYSNEPNDGSAGRSFGNLFPCIYRSCCGWNWLIPAKLQFLTGNAAIGGGLSEMAGCGSSQPPAVISHYDPEGLPWQPWVSTLFLLADFSYSLFWNTSSFCPPARLSLGWRDPHLLFLGLLCSQMPLPILPPHSQATFSPR